MLIFRRTIVLLQPLISICTIYFSNLDYSLVSRVTILDAVIIQFSS